MNVKLLERGNQRNKYDSRKNRRDEKPRDYSLQFTRPKYLQKFQWRFVKCLNQFRNGKSHCWCVRNPFADADENQYQSQLQWIHQPVHQLDNRLIQFEMNARNCAKHGRCAQNRKDSQADSQRDAQRNFRRCYTLRQLADNQRDDTFPPKIDKRDWRHRHIQNLYRINTAGRKLENCYKRVTYDPRRWVGGDGALRK